MILYSNDISTTFPAHMPRANYSVQCKNSFIMLTGKFHDIKKRQQTITVQHLKHQLDTKIWRLDTDEILRRSTFES